MQNDRDRNKSAKRVERVKAPNFVRVYTSDALIHMSYFDIRITFGECIEYDSSRDVGIVEDRAAVTMTPEHARSLHAILGATLLSYEQTHGPLRPPSPRGETPSKKKGKD